MPVPSGITGTPMIGFRNPPDLFFFGYSPSFLYSIRGITWPMEEAPSFNTLGQKTAGGREVRQQLYGNPLHAWKLKWSVLYNDSLFDPNPSVGPNPYTDLQLFYSFFCAMTGKAQEFLYAPRESAVVGQPLAQPDTNGYIELVYSLGSFFAESVQELNGATPTVKYNGFDVTSDLTFYGPASVAPYDGIVFKQTSGSPLSGGAFTADFNFFYRCHFDEDAISFEEFMYKLMRGGLNFSQERI